MIDCSLPFLNNRALGCTSGVLEMKTEAIVPTTNTPKPTAAPAGTLTVWPTIKLRSWAPKNDAL